MIDVDIDDNEDKINLIGKVAKFPKNTKASKAYDFLENIKITKNKIWYFIIEKEIVSDDSTNSINELQVIKYNNKQGYDCNKFMESLKTYYSKNPMMLEYVKNFKIDGNDKFSIIRNIPNVNINGKSLITILSEDLIKLLYR